LFKLEQYGAEFPVRERLIPEQIPDSKTIPRSIGDESNMYTSSKYK